MGTHPIFESRKACKTSGKCSNWRQRHGATKEEDRPQGFEHGRQKAPESAEKALDQPHPWHWGSEHVPRRWLSDPLHQSQGASLAPGQHVCNLWPGGDEASVGNAALHCQPIGPGGIRLAKKACDGKVGEESQATQAAKDDDVPDLEGDFEEASKQEEQAAKNEDAGTSEAAE